MKTSRKWYFGAALGVAFFLAAALVVTSAGPPTAQTPVASDVLTGVVSGPNGPEAGVWVIAETTDLPTRYIKIVVTDDQGRYLMPELPAAGYQVWVRGYGLVDSPRVQASPGRTLDLTAVTAPNPLAAAQYYPSGYWTSLMEVPSLDEFPGTGTAGNELAPRTQDEYLRLMKSGGCWSCHVMGTKATREIPAALGHYDSTVAAWERRIQSGQAGTQMLTGLMNLGKDRALAMFADWTDRIVAGEVPPTPPRPQGIERNVVITQWDWADPLGYLHDEVSTDRRNPTVNANGLIYGAMELSKDYLPVLDPIRHTVSEVPLRVRDPETQPAQPPTMLAPSPYWGDEIQWTSKNNVHNPMFDELGRVWLTSTVRPPANPDFCREGSDHPSARAFPMNAANRHLAVYDPRTQDLTLISTCFSTHHLMFAEDANNTLWTSGGGPVVGWLDRKLFDETGDEVLAQGWTPLILDTNGNGQRDAYVEPDQPVDASLDKRILAPFYGVAPATDGSVWGSYLAFPGGLVRLSPGANPSETALVEHFEVPWNNPAVPNIGYSPRGMDIDRDNVVWMAMASGHMASFDRRLCTGPLNGPTAMGQHCPEGWRFYQEPMPQYKNVTAPGSVEGSYYTWVDQFNTSGLGANTPINTGNASEGLLVLKDGQWVILRVPYPLGFFTKWMDGRIDDPNGGWKGRALWATNSSRVNFHMETGKGTQPKVLKFQIRPDPLAQ